jgi:DNA-binding NarL/FixJ family response regulator
MNKTNSISVCIVDDHVLFRAGLTKLLESTPTFQVIGEVGSGEELLKFLTKHSTNIIILDISLPDTNGIKLMKELHTHYPKIKVLILSMHKVPEYCRLALKEGALGYVLKEDAFDQVINALDMISHGHQYISPAISAAAAEHYLSNNSMLPDILTKTERKVLELIASGMSNKEVAATLGSSVRTVETHRAHILKKLHLKNTAGLVQFALKNHLIQSEKL